MERKWTLNIDLALRYFGGTQASSDTLFQAEKLTFSCKEWCDGGFDIKCIYFFVLVGIYGTSTHKRSYSAETPNKNDATPCLSWRTCRQIKMYFSVVYIFVGPSVSVCLCVYLVVLSVRLSANCNIVWFFWSAQGTKFTCGVHFLCSTHLQTTSTYTTC